MDTLILQAKEALNYSDTIKNRLRNEPFVTPTDTVYGISMSFGIAEAPEKLAKIKNRAHSRFILLVSDLEEVHRVAKIDHNQRAVLERYWPGPISFIVSKIDSAGTLALRWPKNDFLIDLMRVIGGPIWSTSANPHGNGPASTIEAAQTNFVGKIYLFLDGGPLSAETTSTLVDLTTSPYSVLRSGAVLFP